MKGPFVWAAWRVIEGRRGGALRSLGAESRGGRPTARRLALQVT